MIKTAKLNNARASYCAPSCILADEFRLDGPLCESTTQEGSLEDFTEEEFIW